MRRSTWGRLLLIAALSATAACRGSDGNPTSADTGIDVVAEPNTSTVTARGAEAVTPSGGDAAAATAPSTIAAAGLAAPTAPSTTAAGVPAPATEGGAASPTGAPVSTSAGSVPGSGPVAVTVAGDASSTTADPGTSTASSSSVAAPPSTLPYAPVHELPGGGHVLFPGRRFVALYGHPGDDNLGVLGEQDVAAAVERARAVAAEYAGVSAEPVVPTFEIITTVASSEAGADGDYSLESSIDHIRPWVDAAREAGMYVVLDLQPGYTDFLTQAMRYEELLAQPHVGLALDPEWRLAPGERHLRDIGQVSADEVNRVSEWLAELTRRHQLPQKLLLLHQFRVDMLPDRAQIVSRPELAVVVQMDGLGPQDVKLDTWGIITTLGPPEILFGWKNFYDEDSPLRSPAETVALTPSPVFISYQ